jgi:hypothetical protein
MNGCDIPAVYKDYRDCITVCVDSDKTREVQQKKEKQAAIERENQKEVERRNACVFKHGRNAAEILNTQFILPINHNVAWIYNNTNADREVADMAISRLKRETFNALLQAGDALRQENSACATPEVLDIYPRATHLLAELDREIPASLSTDTLEVIREHVGMMIAPLVLGGAMAGGCLVGDAAAGTAAMGSAVIYGAGAVSLIVLFDGIRIQFGAILGTPRLGQLNSSNIEKGMTPRQMPPNVTYDRL